MALRGAYGTFIKRGNRIFRTEARIKWGDSDEPLGLLIMLNPGSSKLVDENLWLSFLSNNEPPNLVTDKIILDGTMQTVVHILEECHPNLNGVLIIQNLFNLRDSKSEDAILTYRELFQKNDIKSLSNCFNLCVRKEYRDVLHKEMTREYLKTFPWVWLAWTVDDGKILNARRRVVLNNIPPNMKKFAVYSRQKCHEKHKELYTYHVCPRNPKDRVIYSADMIKQMKEYWKNNR